MLSPARRSRTFVLCVAPAGTIAPRARACPGNLPDRLSCASVACAIQDKPWCMGDNSMKDLMSMMKQAQQLQERMQKMQEELAAMEIEGQSGAGLVRITLNGKGDMRHLKIDPSLMKPDEKEILE